MSFLQLHQHLKDKSWAKNDSEYVAFIEFSVHFQEVVSLEIHLNYIILVVIWIGVKHY